MKYICLILLCCSGTLLLHAQDTLFESIALPEKMLDKLEHQQAKLQADISDKTNKTLNSLKRQEERLYQRLSKLDSSKAAALMKNLENEYSKLQSKLSNPEQTISEYIPRLDSLATMFKFLGPLSKNKAGIQNATGQLDQLKNSLGGVAVAQQFMQERQQYLKTLCASYKELPKKYIDKYLSKYSKELGYYKAYVTEWKETIKDPQKLEQLALKMLNKLPAFQQFMQEHGELAGLFGQGSAGNNSTVNLGGLQTRQQVMQGIQQQFGSQAGNPRQYVQQQVQSVQPQINELQSKLNDIKSGSYGNGDADMPDKKPLNSQKTKSFLKRLEYGINLQSPIKQYQFPASNDLAVMLGYKLNDRFITGIGLAYKFSLGPSFKEMHFSHEGIGLRSYLDWKISTPLKGRKSLLANIWISGGYEMNYWQRFQEIPGYHSLLWTKSGLLGITKKIERGKRNIKTQVLWDFLSYETNATPVVFRVQYNF